MKLERSDVELIVNYLVKRRRLVSRVMPGIGAGIAEDAVAIGEGLAGL